MIYRFKIKFDEEEDFNAVLEVEATHSFYHLHNIAQEAIGFDKKQTALFYTANDSWKALKEIPIESDFADVINKNGSMPLIGQYINQPFQKFIYVADKENEWVLECELVLLTEGVKGKKYPSIVRTEGYAPRQFIAEPILDDEEELLKEEEEPTAFDFESIIPKASSDNDDLSLEDFPDLEDIDELDFSDES